MSERQSKYVTGDGTTQSNKPVEAPSIYDLAADALVSKVDGVSSLISPANHRVHLDIASIQALSARYPDRTKEIEFTVNLAIAKSMRLLEKELSGI